MMLQKDVYKSGHIRYLIDGRRVNKKEYFSIYMRLIRK